MDKTDDDLPKDHVQGQDVEEEKITSVPSLPLLEQECSNLSYQLDQYTHEIVPQLMKKHFAAPTVSSPFTPILNNSSSSENINNHSFIQDENKFYNMDYLRQVLQVESSLSKKVFETQIIRSFESLAGLSAQRLMEEQGKREASIELLKKEWETRVEEIRIQVQDFIHKKNEIQNLMDIEKQQRIRGDEHVLEIIIQEKKILQDKILDMFP